MRFTGTILAATLTTAAITSCGAQAESDQPSGSPGASESWRRLPDPPLAARDHAVVVGVDERMLVVGGWEFLCPPSADCSTPEAPLLTDGAVYDPETNSWSTTTPAPFGVRRQEYATAALDGSAYLISGCANGTSCNGQPRLLSYDLAVDRWADHGQIPGAEKYYRHIATVGDALLVYSGSDEHGEIADVLFDPKDSIWTELPDDPLPRTFDRFIVPSGDQLVLTGSSIAALNDGDSVKLAARFDATAGEWTRLPHPPGRGYQLMPTDSGPLLNGHFIDSPGWLLNPETWTWSGLPGQAREHTDLGGVLNRHHAIYDVPNSVGQTASANRLFVYDSRTEEFVTIPAPPGREDVYDDSSTALGRDLFVYGGQRWTGDGLDSDGELMGDAWLWTAPVN